MPPVQPIFPPRSAPNATPRRPRLLVSVRSAAEAEAAATGGADVIDVKEPAAGPLGAPSPEVVADVIRIVAGRHPVTVACGDLDAEGPRRAARLGGVPGVTAVKLAAIGPDWAARLADVADQTPSSVTVIPTFYADHAARNGLSDAITTCSRLGFGGVLIDTAKKANGDLFSYQTDREVAALISQADRVGVDLALAGSLRGPALRHAATLRPAVVGVRGAVCRSGRDGAVERPLVADAAATIAAATQTSAEDCV